MASTLIQRSSSEPRQLTPKLSLSNMKVIAVTDPVTQIRARHDTFYRTTSSKSEEELLAYYSEEFFLENAATVEEELEFQAQQVSDAIVMVENAQSFEQNGVVLAGVVCSFQTTSAGVNNAAFAAENAALTVNQTVQLTTQIHYKQQVCRPYPTGTDILFDKATPEEAERELALRAIFAREHFPALYMRPVKPAKCTSTPELLDISELKVRPALTVPAPAYDPVSRMLDDVACGDVVQETASVYTARQGRSLVRSSPSYGDDVGVTGWEAGYEREVRHITRYSALPGLEHLVAAEIRPVIVDFDQHVVDNDQDTGEDEVPEACRTGRCFCLCYPDSDDSSISEPCVQQDAGESLFYVIDDIVSEAWADDDVVKTPTALTFSQAESLNINQALPLYPSPLLASSSQAPPSSQVSSLSPPGEFYNLVRSQYADYVARNGRTSGLPCDVADTISALPAVSEHNSGSSDENNESSVVKEAQHAELNDSDTESQAHMEYNALISIMNPPDTSRDSPRMYRAENNFNFDEALVGSVVEIGEMSPSSDVEQSENTSWPDAELDAYTDFDFEYALAEGIFELGEVYPSSDAGGSEVVMPSDVRCSDPVKVNYRHYLLIRFYRRHGGPSRYENLRHFQSLRPQRPSKLSIVTDLSEVMNSSADDNDTLLSSSSSGSSIGFVDKRGFVRELASEDRRTNIFPGR